MFFFFATNIFALAVWPDLSVLPMDFIEIKHFSDRWRFGAML